MTGEGGHLTGDERVVPAYALTGGRTRAAGRELALEALVMSNGWAPGPESGLQPESLAILRLAASPVSVAEVGATLRVPVGVARVLVGDLVEAGYLTLSAPVATDADGRPRREVLERLLDGLRAR